MSLYTLLHNLLNVIVQIENKIGLQKKLLHICVIDFGSWTDLLHKFSPPFVTYIYIYICACFITFLLHIFLTSAASVVYWSEFLATDPEVWVRFPALPDFLRSSESGTGSTQPHEYN
jgi:hypothetical protein